MRLPKRLPQQMQKEGMESTTILRRRMKKAGITLKSVAYLAGESEQTVCRVLNKDLVEKIHAAGNTLVKQANEKLTKELFDAEYAE
jgi:lambda repressor-like predicted transcriptional regulator